VKKNHIWLLLLAAGKTKIYAANGKTNKLFPPEAEEQIMIHAPAGGGRTNHNTFSRRRRELKK
jgi:hypothetical protein